VCDLERLDRALIAIQGPHAEAALARLATPARDMRFMDVQAIEILGADCVASRSGYTGEDGFEISIPRERVHDIAAALLEDSAVALIGLGARDSLRLEAGLCLYGADLDPTTTPVEADLAWAIQPVRRRGGARAGGFPGDGVILQQIDSGSTRIRVGFLPDGRAPVRAGSPVFGTEDAATASGLVTSGGFGPSVDRPIAMGYVPVSLSAPGTALFADVRGKRMAMTVTTLPFVQTKFKRRNRR
jgi:aminomethyltransferase